MDKMASESAFYPFPKIDFGKGHTTKISAPLVFPFLAA